MPHDPIAFLFVKMQEAVPLLAFLEGRAIGIHIAFEHDPRHASLEK
jgi:hypothetical protein